MLAMPFATCMILSKSLYPYLKNNTYLSFKVVAGTTNNVYSTDIVTIIKRNVDFEMH